MTTIEVVWRTYKAEVEEELRKILNVDALNPSAPVYFQNRMAAAKIVFECMDEERKQHVATLVQDYKQKGNTRELQEK